MKNCFTQKLNDLKMKKNILAILVTLSIFAIHPEVLKAQDDPGVKTTVDITVDNVGDAVCDFKYKYNAAYWDYFTKTIGNNTSIIKNNILRVFPKYNLTDFDYSQKSDERTNTVKFKILGMVYIDKNGRWTADLDTKNPDITKISDKDYLLMESGNQIKIHLPAGTSDSKIEKDSFGKAVLTYPADETGGTGKMFMIGGLVLMAAGGFLLYRNMKAPKLKTMYGRETAKQSLGTSAGKQILNERNSEIPRNINQDKVQQPDYKQDTHEG